MKKRLFLILASFVLIVCTLSGCALSDDEEYTPELPDATISEGANYSGLSFKDIYGNEYNDIFKEHKLTVVNLFGTWCSPCVREIPELQQLSEKYAADDVAVVGIVTDAYVDHQYYQNVVDIAVDIAKDASVTYPFLIPDETNFNGFIDTMQTFPQTLFIDKDGNVVMSVVGSNDLDTWSDYVDKAVKKIEK